jgi:hypothetical protein
MILFVPFFSVSFSLFSSKQSGVTLPLEFSFTKNSPESEKKTPRHPTKNLPVGVFLHKEGKGFFYKMDFSSQRLQQITFILIKACLVSAYSSKVTLYSVLILVVGPCVASIFQNVPQAPADVIFSLTSNYKADTHPQKINVGVGAFRTDELKPYVLPVVKKVT